MHLDKRDFHGRKRVAQRNTGVREGGRVDDDEADPLPTRGVDTIDQVGFTVALKTINFHTYGGTLLAKCGVDVGQGLAAVMLGFPSTQQVQIRAVQNQYALTRISGLCGI